MFNRLAHKRQLRRRPVNAVAVNTTSPKPVYEVAPSADDFVIESLEPRLLMAAVAYNAGTKALTITLANNEQSIVFSGLTSAVNFSIDGVPDGGSQNVILGVPTLYPVSSITLTLGSGGDVVSFPGAFTVGANITGGSGPDTITATDGRDTIDGGGGDDVIDSSKGADSVNGGAGNDSINGNEGNDTLIGGSENDTLIGNSGNDSLDGGTGADVVDGGDGTDNLNGNAGADTITGGAGADTVTSTGDDASADSISTGDGNARVAGD